MADSSASRRSKRTSSSSRAGGGNARTAGKRTSGRRRPPAGPKGFDGSVAQSRSRLVFAGFMVSALIALGRGVQLQVHDYPKLSHKSWAETHVTQVLPARRGEIMDRNGRPLAVSAPVEDVWAVPDLALAYPSKLAQVARLVGRSPQSVAAALRAHQGKDFYYVQRGVTPALARRVKALHAPGINLRQVFKRYYPMGPAAAQVVGYANIDQVGQAGVERVFEHTLSGQPGKRVVVQNAAGQAIRPVKTLQHEVKGHNLRLSLSENLQYVAYTAVKQAAIAHHAKGGAAVVIDPRSGQVLALANWPSYNPNNRSTIHGPGLQDRAVSWPIPPGSTAKGPLIARALETGLVTPQTHVPYPNWGVLPVAQGVVVRDDGAYGQHRGWITVNTLIKKSSDVGAAEIALQMGSKEVWKAFRQLGFGETTGLPLTGAQSGTLPSWLDMNKPEVAETGFGYGITATVAQLARAYGVIADDGRMHRLTLLAGQSSPGRQVMSAKAAAAMRQVLQGPLQPGGTAPAANLSGVAVAGKTGTSQVLVHGKYSDTLHNALFVGMLPAEHPTLVCAVAIMSVPGKSGYFGGEVAAPVFKKIMEKALFYDVGAQPTVASR